MWVNTVFYKLLKYINISCLFILKSMLRIKIHDFKILEDEKIKNYIMIKSNNF